MGPPQLPKAFTALAQVESRPDTNVNVMGIVTDYRAPAATRGEDWMCTFNICDDSNIAEGCGKAARWFSTEAQMPAITGSGDVVLLRNVKLKSWGGDNVILSNRTSKWTVIPHAFLSKESMTSNEILVKSPRSHGQVAPSPLEVLYARYIHDSSDASAFTAASEFRMAAPKDVGPNAASNAPIADRPAPLVKRDKFSLIKDVQVKGYSDLVGQVVKLYSNMSHVELYVTDYTSNNLLFHYANPDEPLCEGDPYEPSRRSRADKLWPGPYGKQTLCVTLWPPHDEYALQKVRLGMFVYLRNVHIKQDGSLRIEGKLHTDQRYPSRVQIEVIDEYKRDERCKEILRRKLTYERSLKPNHIADALAGQKRKAPATLDEPDFNKENESKKKSKAKEPSEATKQEPPPGETKQQGRKRRKRELAAAARLAAAKAGSNAPPKPTTKLALNAHIRTQNPAQPGLTLAQILTPREEHVTYTTPGGNTFRVPFSNVKYRTKPVRVVDYFPENLEQWCMRHKESEMDCLVDDDDDADAETNRDENASSQWSSAGSDDDGDDDSAPDDDDGYSGLGPNAGRRAFYTQARPSMAKTGKWKWQWRFALRLEDYPPPPPSQGDNKGRMWVFVTKADAECLLKLDARNLRAAGEKSKTVLAQVREKMFLLWGDLEERKGEEKRKRAGEAAGEERKAGEREKEGVGEGRKEEGSGGGGKGEEKGRGREEIGPRGLPFECCLKEYGVRRRKGVRKGKGGDDGEVEGFGWDRRWAMFGTVIS